MEPIIEITIAFVAGFIVGGILAYIAHKITKN